MSLLIRTHLPYQRLSSCKMTPPCTGRCLQPSTARFRRMPEWFADVHATSLVPGPSTLGALAVCCCAVRVAKRRLPVCNVASDTEEFGDKRPLMYHHERMDHDTVMQMRAEKVAQYLERWRPDHEMSSRWNVMTILMMVAFATPLIGLAFAAMTYGNLWGTSVSTALPL